MVTYEKGPESMQLLNSQEAAAYVGLEYEAFRQHVKKGHLQPALSAPRANFFTPAALDEFQTSRRPRGRPKGRTRKKATA